MALTHPAYLSLDYYVVFFFSVITILFDNMHKQPAGWHQHHMFFSQGAPKGEHNYIMDSAIFLYTNVY